MSALFVSKSAEAKVIASIRSMGVESLNPDDYEDLERILNTMCETRSIDSDAVGTGPRREQAICLNLLL